MLESQLLGEIDRLGFSWTIVADAKASRVRPAHRQVIFAEQHWQGERIFTIAHELWHILQYTHQLAWMVVPPKARLPREYSAWLNPAELKAGIARFTRVYDQHSPYFRKQGMYARELTAYMLEAHPALIYDIAQTLKPTSRSIICEALYFAILSEKGDYEHAIRSVINAGLDGRHLPRNSKLSKWRDRFGNGEALCERIAEHIQYWQNADLTS